MAFFPTLFLLYIAADGKDRTSDFGGGRGNLKNYLPKPPV